MQTTTITLTLKESPSQRVEKSIEVKGNLGLLCKGCGPVKK